MKRILAPIVIALTFTVMFSSTSYAGWTRVVSAGGNTHYVDFERIRKHDGYVYYWMLQDYLKPNEYGYLSGESYTQGDCELFRVKWLSYVHHKQPMGRDVGEANSPNDPEWVYPGPNTGLEAILKYVCLVS